MPMPSFRIRKIKTPVAVPGGLQTREAHEIVNVLIQAFSAGACEVKFSSPKKALKIMRVNLQSIDTYIAGLSGCKPNTPDANLVLGLKCGS
jgi:hypothetical protein